MKTLRWIVVGLLSFMFSSSALAQNVTVTAQVPTKVSLTNSTLTVSPNEILADNSELAVATVTLVDANDTAMEGIIVTLSSNRGETDTIKAYESGVIGSDSTVETDSNGIAKFAIRSAVAGTATLSAVVDFSEDILVQSASLTIKSLPVITQVSVTVTIPGVGKVSIIKPQLPQVIEDDTESVAEPTKIPNIDKQKIVETGVNIDLGFWQSLLILLLILLLPTAIGLIVLLIGKTSKLRKQIIKYQDQESAMLEKIYQLEGQIATTAAAQAQMTKQLGETIAAEEAKIEQKLDDLNASASAEISQAPQPQVSDDQTVAQE